MVGFPLFWCALLACFLFIFASFVQTFLTSNVESDKCTSAWCEKRMWKKMQKHRESTLIVDIKKWNNTTKYLCQSKDHCLNDACLWWWSYLPARAASSHTWHHPCFARTSMVEHEPYEKLWFCILDFVFLHFWPLIAAMDCFWYVMTQRHTTFRTKKVASTRTTARIDVLIY